MRVLISLIAVLLLAGCVVQQGMTVTRTADYDAEGRLTGYKVIETLNLPGVARPADRAQSDVVLFETYFGGRKPAHWPPPASGSTLQVDEDAGSQPPPAPKRAPPARPPGRPGE